VVDSKCSPNHFISVKYKTVLYLRYVSCTMVPLWNNTLMPVTIKLLETFLETIFLKPFQLFRRILNDVCGITKVPSLQWWFQSREQEKNQLQPSQESMGDAPVLSHCSLLKDPQAKPNGVLEHCREGQTNRWFSIFRGISYWPHPYGDEGYQRTFLYSE
jgi:hypothetical protein